MDGGGFIAAVQLSDRDEDEQPEPLYISGDDMKSLTWRHFALLLKSLYVRPPAPEVIRCKYLDDEGDWVELGSDAELKEALKIWNVRGDILQLKVHRVDSEQPSKYVKLPCDDQFAVFPSCPSSAQSSSDFSFESDALEQNAIRQSLDSKNVSKCESSDHGVFIPTTDLSCYGLPILKYPHQNYPHNEDFDRTGAAHSLSMDQDTGQVTLNPRPELVTAPVSKSEAKEVTDADTPTIQSQEPQKEASVPTSWIYPEHYPHKVSSSASFVSSNEWAEAASLTTDEKIGFLKNKLALANNKNVSAVSKEPKIYVDRQQLICRHPQYNEQSLSKNINPNQDPFEIDGVSTSQKSPTMPILTPTLPMQFGKFPRTMDAGQMRGAPCLENTEAQNPAFAVFVDPAQARLSLSVEKSILSANTTNATMKSHRAKNHKENGSVPVPMPRNLLMMEGAQSGANAVAIEMPESESYHGAACNKEEEIAASGGASSTSASEETGETLARGGGSVAASIDQEMTENSLPESCKVIPLTTSKENSSSGINSSLNKKSKVLQKKSSDLKNSSHGDISCGARPKVFEKKSKSESKKLEKSTVKHTSLENKKVKDDFEKKKVKDVEVKKKRAKDGEKGSKKDEESGETAMDRVKAKTGKSTLQLEDFLKHMKKVKTELHTSIVKDVSKQTEKALKKTLSRSSSLTPDIEFKFCNVKGSSDTVIHKGITCDHCDLEIVGVRYKCGNCPDFDLCEKCESSEFVHDPTHVFLKLRKPARRAGCGTGKCVPLLVDNIYEVEALHEMRRKEKEMKKEKEKNTEENSTENQKQDKETMLATVPGEWQMEKLVEILQNVERMENNKEMQSLPLDLPALDESVREDVHSDAVTPNVPVCPERFSSATSKSNIMQMTSLPTDSAQQICETPSQQVELFNTEEEQKCLLENSAGNPGVEEDCKSVLSDSSYEYYLSDDDNLSDHSDFSVISPPDREEYEEISYEDVQETIINRPDNVQSNNGPNLNSSLKLVSNTKEGFEEIKELLEVTNEEDRTGGKTADETQQMSDQPTVGEDENNNENVLINDNTSEKTATQDAPQEIDAQEKVVAPEIEGEACPQGNADSTKTEQKSGKSSFEDLMKEVIEKATESENRGYYEEMLLTILAKEKQAEKQKGKDEKKDSEKKGKKELLRRHLESSLESEKKDSDRKGKKELLRRHLEKVKETDDKKEDYLEILSLKAEQAGQVNRQLVETKSLNHDSTIVNTREDTALLYKSQRDRHLAEMLELERQKFAALNAGDLETVDRIELRLQDMDHNMPETSWSINATQSSVQRQPHSNGQTVSPTELTGATFSHQNSLMSSSIDSVSDCGSQVKDADSQTSAEPVSHLIHNVATGVSKVMNSTLSTAKDVFYSLQAKNAKKFKESSTEKTESEDKPTGEISPVNSWTPSKDSWMPPQNTWIPPQSTWVPPKSTWVPPPDTWTPPPDMWFPPSTEQQSSQVDPDKDVTIPKSLGENQTNENAAIIRPPIIDNLLRQEMLGMQRLMEMGFANRERNRALLTRFNYDLEKVVQSLLHEDAQDPWFYRQQGQE